jgi:hypothetical protein
MRFAGSRLATTSFASMRSAPFATFDVARRRFNHAMRGISAYPPLIALRSYPWHTIELLTITFMKNACRR